MATDNQANKSKKQLAMERIKRDRPDLDENDEEGLFGAVSDDYAHSDSEISRLTDENKAYAEREQQFANYLTASENNGQYFEGMLEGRDLFEVAAEMHGYDALLEYLQSEEARKKYAKANEAFKKRMDEDKRLTDERQKNLAETDSQLAAAIEAGEFGEEDCKEAIASLFDLSDALKNNVCKPEWIKMWLNAKNHDGDVDAARNEAYSNGLNDGIDKQMTERSRKRGAGKPGMPIGAGGEGTPRRNNSGGSIADRLFEK